MAAVAPGQKGRNRWLAFGRNVSLLGSWPSFGMRGEGVVGSYPGELRRGKGREEEEEKEKEKKR